MTPGYDLIVIGAGMAGVDCGEQVRCRGLARRDRRRASVRRHLRTAWVRPEEDPASRCRDHRQRPTDAGQRNRRCRPVDQLGRLDPAQARLHRPGPEKDGGRTLRQRSGHAARPGAVHWTEHHGDRRHLLPRRTLPDRRRRSPPATGLPRSRTPGRQHRLHGAPRIAATDPVRRWRFHLLRVRPHRGTRGQHPGHPRPRAKAAQGVRPRPRRTPGQPRR